MWFESCGGGLGCNAWPDASLDGLDSYMAEACKPKAAPSFASRETSRRRSLSRSFLAEEADKENVGLMPKQPAAALAAGKKKADEWHAERLRAREWAKYQQQLHKNGVGGGSSWHAHGGDDLLAFDDDTTQASTRGGSNPDGTQSPSSDVKEFLEVCQLTTTHSSEVDSAAPGELRAREAKAFEHLGALSEMIKQTTVRLDREAEAAAAAAAQEIVVAAEAEAAEQEQRDAHKQELLNQERLRLERQRLDKEKMHAFLADNGFADINAKRKTSIFKYKYPLHSAVKRNDAEIVRILLAAGADICLRNSAGQSAVDLAVQYNKHGSHDAVLRELGHGHSVRCS